MAGLGTFYGLFLIPHIQAEPLADFSEQAPLYSFPSRLYLAIMLLLSLIIPQWEQHRGGTHRKLMSAVFLFAGFYLVSAMLAVLLATIPADFHLDPVFRQRAEMVVAFLYGASLLGYLVKRRWRHSYLDYYILLGLGVFVIEQGLFRPFVERALDSHFAAANFTEIFGHALILAGLILNYRMRMTLEAREGMQQRDSIVEHSLDGVIDINSEGEISLFNSAAQKMFGYSSDEVLGRNVSMLMPAPIQQEHDGYLKRYLESGLKLFIGTTREVTALRKSGETFPIELSITETRLGGMPVFTGLVRDISERKKKEAHLEKLSTKLMVAVEAGGLGIWEWDQKTNSFEWDEQMYRLHGLQPGSGLPSWETWLESVHPEDRQACIDMRQAILQSHTPVAFEYRIVLPDGSVRWLKQGGKVMRGDSGQPVGVIAFSSDISADKQHMAELEAARIEADAANQAKSEFLATISHEIRTPMNGVIGMVEVLQQSGLKDKQLEMANLIKDSARSLLGIIKDILDFSKIESGKLELHLGVVSIEGVAEEVCAMLNRLAGENNVELMLFIDPAIPKNLLGDSQHLRQVLVNLVGNAVKFSGNMERQGRVSVRAGLTGLAGDRFTLEIQVIDNGIGMDEWTQERLFQPFTQADSSSSRRYGGTGLGLSISQRLVELMGGTINAQSTPGQGSTFTVQLPFERLQAAPELHDSEVDIAGLSCLVIEGSGSLASDLEVYLTYADASVERVSGLGSEYLRSDSARKDSRVWIVDDSDNHTSAEELLDALNSHQATVVISRGNRFQPRRGANGIIRLDGNALQRKSLLTAVAMASGRATQDSEVRRSPRAVNTARSPDETLLKGLPILVAEDNETNQKVIRHQLGLLGYTADIASNGREALQYWRSGHYALLLCDLQMPEMNGLELTQAIRNEETGLRHTPIVALTANALTEEVERCLSVGMDEYISKPASLDDLRSALEKWLPPVTDGLTNPPETKEHSADGATDAQPDPNFEG